MQKNKGFCSKQMWKVTIFISPIKKLNYSHTYFHQEFLLEILMHFLKSLPNRKLANFTDFYLLLLYSVLLCSIPFSTLCGLKTDVMAGNWIFSSMRKG